MRVRDVNWRTSAALCGAIIGFAGVMTADATTAATREARLINLSGFEAKREVVDRVLTRPPRIVRTAALRRVYYVDQSGNLFSIETDQDSLNTQPFANVLASIIHRAEISDLQVFVTSLASLQATCGGPPVVACYLPEDPAQSFRGKMWVAFDDADWVHSLVHEYGHHMDNQLINLGHLSSTCNFSADGSRNWFFEREVVDQILGSGFSCAPDGEWEYLLAELYAEDFVWANGIQNWQLSSARSPTSAQVAVLKEDIDFPYITKTSKWGPSRVRRKRARVKTLRIYDWTFLDLRLKGPRKADLDLFLFARGRQRALATSRRRGSRERIRYVLPPGTYSLLVDPYRGSGLFTLSIIRE